MSRKLENPKIFVCMPMPPQKNHFAAFELLRDVAGRDELVWQFPPWHIANEIFNLDAKRLLIGFHTC
jgi:hypothetical protein